jgi:hypothetical protein
VNLRPLRVHVEGHVVALARKRVKAEMWRSDVCEGLDPTLCR